MADESSAHEIESSAVAKASWRILPLLGLAYLIAYMDRVNISFAATQMNDELGFSATVYGFGGGMFFLAYALFEVPSNMIMLRFGPRRWIARIMITWGLFSAAMMFIQTPLHFYVLRFLIGFAEAGFFPAVVFYLAHWFPTAVRGRAISRFYVAGPLAAVVMGIVSSWLLSMHGMAGLHGWQWLFLLEGLPAVIVGLIVLWRLPDTPEKSTFLTDPEREWLMSELAADAKLRGPDDDHNILRALGNPLVRWLGVIGCMTIGAFYGLTLSAPEVLMDGTGLDVEQAGYAISFGGILGAISMLSAGWFSDRRGDRFIALLVALALMAAGLALIALSTSAPMVVAGYLLFSTSWTVVTVSQVMIWADVLPFRMLAICAAAINTVSQIGAFVAPILWGMAKDATGGFELGLYGSSATVLVVLWVTVLLRARIRHGTVLRSPIVLQGEAV